MSNSTSKQISSKELNIFFNNTTNELKKITRETVKLYNKQCQILKKQIKILSQIEVMKMLILNGNKNYVLWRTIII